MDNLLKFRYRQYRVISEVGARKGRPSGRWNGLSKRAGCIPGKSGVREARDVMGSEIIVAEVVEPMPTRKATQRAISAPVPQTDTGRWGENPKARERNLVKELGKMIP